MTDTAMVPFYRSYLLNQTVHLDKIKDMPLRDVELLNVETLAALNEARHRYGLLESKDSDEASGEFRKMKIAGYFQAAIQIELANR
jgi:phosphoglycolate phosphatase-like HAD superfamily hydrolase